MNGESIEYMSSLIVRMQLKPWHKGVFSLEEQIIHYDLKYSANKDFSILRAIDGLQKSVYYRMKKIKFDHCA